MTVSFFCGRKEGNQARIKDELLCAKAVSGAENKGVTGGE